MDKIKVVIVDDEVVSTSARRQNIDFLIKDQFIDVVPLHPTEVKEWLDLHINPDLIIVDYRLNSVSKDGKRYDYSGASFFSLFRDAYPDVPIYLISAVIDLEHGEFESDLFDRLISDRQLTDEKFVLSDASDYKRIKEKNLSKFEEIYSLIKAPDICKEELERMLRPILKMHSNERLSSADSKSLVFSRWVSILIRDRGLLYDDLSASTLLGVSLEYFRDHVLNSQLGIQMLEFASYKGVFSDTNERRWWRDALSEFAITQTEGKIIRQVCEILPSLLQLDDSKIAKCVRCQKNYPDSIGRTVADKTRCPVHMECSQIDENQLIVPHFENDRVIMEIE